MKYLNGGVLLFFSFHLMVFVGKAEVIKMTISLEKTTDNFKSMIFSPELFERFYLCMCNNEAENCVANYNLGKSPIEVTSIMSEGSLTGNKMSFPFNLCQNDQRRTAVICTKSNSTNNRRHIQYFLHRNISCERNCVSIVWLLQKEMIDFSKSANYIETNESCIPNYDGTPSNFNKEQENDDNNTTATVVGIVVTLLVLAAIAIIAFFLWRRRKQKSKPPEQHLHLSGITNSNTHDTAQVNRQRNINGYIGTPQLISSTIERHCSDSIDDYAYIADGNTLKGATRNTSKTTDTAVRDVAISQPSHSTTQLDCNDVTDDYAYIADGNTLKGTTNTTPQTPDQASSGSDIYNESNVSGTEDGYYSIDQPNSNRPNVYSKLGQKVKNLKNPYDGLLHPKEDAKTRPPINVPSQANEPANQQSSQYSLAKSPLDDSANPKAVKDTYNHVEGDYEKARADGSRCLEVLAGNDISGSTKNMSSPYFELEKEEDMIEKDYNSTDKTVSPYFELENEDGAQEKDYYT